MITLDIAIITYKPDGIKRLAANTLPQIPGVKYVISWQAHESAPIPEELQRPDIKIYRFDGIGLSHNRNNSIKYCTSDIIILADDDIFFFTDGINKLREVYENELDTDLITFKSLRHGDTIYPENACKLKAKLPANYNIASIELSFRRATAGWLRACPELGLNSPRFHGGEDEMLLHTAIKRGLNCWFYPITVCKHEHPSTGSKAHLTKGNLLANGCVIALTYPKTVLLRIPIKAWRLHKSKQANFFRALLYLIQGAAGALGVLKRNKEYLY
ncbi:MAG: glycosyltransferase [Bacteroidales bacterium]|nr:glycosyltransferase [Bacteroidales bacterium]